MRYMEKTYKLDGVDVGKYCFQVCACVLLPGVCVCAASRCVRVYCFQVCACVLLPGVCVWRCVVLHSTSVQPSAA